MFFHVLKNGLRIDALQLESIEKMERAPVRTCMRSLCSSPMNGRQFSYRTKRDP